MSGRRAAGRAARLATGALHRLGLRPLPSSKQAWHAVREGFTEKPGCRALCSGAASVRPAQPATFPPWLSELRAANRHRDPAKVQAALARLNIASLQSLRGSHKLSALRSVLWGSTITADADLSEIALGLLERESSEGIQAAYSQAVTAHANSSSVTAATALEFLRNRVPPDMLSVKHVDQVLLKAASQGDKDSVDGCLRLLGQNGLQRSQGTYCALLMLEANSGHSDPMSRAMGIDKVWRQLLEKDKAQSGGLEGHYTHCARVCALCRLSHAAGDGGQSALLVEAITQAFQDFISWRRQSNARDQDSPQVATDRLSKATYHSLRALQHLGDSDAFAATVLSATGSGMEPDERILNLVLKHLGPKRISRDLAREMMQQMTRKGTGPASAAYNHLLRAVAKHQGPQAALDEAERALAAGIHMGTGSYNQILSALASSGSFRAAFDLYGTLRSRGVQPDQHTFHLLFKAASCFMETRPRLHQSTAIAAFEGGSTGQWHAQALEVWREGWKAAAPLVHELAADMKKLQVPHSSITMETYTQALGKLNEWKGLMLALEEAKASGCKVSARTYNLVIRTLAANKKIKEARAVMAAMAADGIAPTAVTFTCLISGATCKENLAAKVLEEMKASGVVPDMRFYNKLISVYLGHGNVQAARAMLAEAQGIGLKPQHHTYYTLAEQAARLGDHDLLRWAVPLAQASYTNPNSEYVPPEEYSMLEPLDE